MLVHHGGLAPLLLREYSRSASDSSVRSNIKFSRLVVCLSVCVIPFDVLEIRSYFRVYRSVTDPGFTRGGGVNSPEGGPTHYFAKISRKLHEIERIWMPGDVPRAPLQIWQCR